MKKLKKIRCLILNYCTIVAAVGFVSCKNSTGPGIEPQRKDLVGCWELIQIESAIGFGHKIQFDDSDSAHFLAETVVFQDDSSGTIESKISVGFKKWIIKRDSIFLENGNGTQIRTYPDLTQKIDQIKNLSEDFSFSLDSKDLILQGKWLNGESHAYRYLKCKK